MILPPTDSIPYIIGITGEIGSGKSYLGEKLTQHGSLHGFSTSHFELDRIGHLILGPSQEARHQEVRERIVQTFGQHLRQEDSSIDRRLLGEIVFNDYSILRELNAVMREPMLFEVQRELRDKIGVVFFNAALLAEAQLGYLCSNRVILVTVDEALQQKRLQQREWTQQQIQQRLGSQYRALGKREALERRIAEDGYGRVWEVHSPINPSTIQELWEEVVAYLGVN